VRITKDLLLPALDGWGFLEEKWCDPALRTIPVVVMSAGKVQTPPESIDYVRNLPVEARALSQDLRHHVLRRARRCPSAAPKA